MDIARHRSNGKAGFAPVRRVRRVRWLHGGRFLCNHRRRLTVRDEPGRSEENETDEAPAHRSDVRLTSQHHHQQAAESGGHTQESELGGK